MQILHLVPFATSLDRNLVHLKEVQIAMGMLISIKSSNFLNNAQAHAQVLSRRRLLAMWHL